MSTLATNSDTATTNRRLRHSPCNSIAKEPDELSTAHIPEIPRLVIILPILAVVIAGVSAYFGSLVQDVNAVPMIVATITIVAVTLGMLVEYCRTTMYNYWVSLMFNVCFMGGYSGVIVVIFEELWAMGGRESGTRLAKEQGYSKPHPNSKIKNSGSLTFGEAWLALLVLSALELAIFIIHLIVLSIYVAKHRKAGKCCTPARNAKAEGLDQEDSMGMAEQEAELEPDPPFQTPEQQRWRPYFGEDPFHE